MGNSLKRNKSSNVKDKQKIEPTEFNSEINRKMEGIAFLNITETQFTKYPTLAPELRKHILTYCTDSSFFNYSQCSKLCNSEVQMFNTEPPHTLQIIELTDGVMVDMEYINMSRPAFGAPDRKIRKKFHFSDGKDVMKEIESYLKKYYKYVGQKSTTSLRLNVKQWPIDVMKMKHITNIVEWNVTIYNSMCNDFIEYFISTDHSVSDLCLQDCDEISDRATIPSNFFKSVAFQNLHSARFLVKCEIDSEDFLSLEKRFVHLTSSISFDYIRTKVVRWNDTNHSDTCLIAIQLPDDDNRVLDVYEIFLPFYRHIQPVENSVVEKYKIGKVEVWNGDGERQKIFVMNFQ